MPFPRRTQPGPVTSIVPAGQPGAGLATKSTVDRSDVNRSPSANPKIDWPSPQSPVAIALSGPGGTTNHFG